MSFPVNKSIKFNEPPTLDEAIKALEMLRTDAGGDAKLRVRGQIASAMNSAGPYPSGFTAERAGE